ncbi:hypothetical protein Tco_0125581 [Tanacetum coccineum]
MAPTTRRGPNTPVNNTNPNNMTPESIHFVANETEKVDKYISRLLDNIYGNVKSARPKTLDETIELANDLMAECRQGVNNMGTGEKKPYGGSLPKSSGNTMVLILRRAMRQIPKGMVILNVELYDISREIVQS